ncbi:hypothetical protein RFI_11800 [Reticulomyxa filosa]|uniref:Uncharacterized protein n=1 Tax=Reticulomyxa filosa TaxID=46433 RepID=X6NHY1_RETFI|nr:hypothetical protein RFI_11800 [Reticulomyxa filosa]|eukprot:ETO25339.1 hypothetical protein RFI_11800 [Reticulomyxa filosa]
MGRETHQKKKPTLNKYFLQKKKERGLEEKKKKTAQTSQEKNIDSNNNKKKATNLSFFLATESNEQNTRSKKRKRAKIQMQKKKKKIILRKLQKKKAYISKDNENDANGNSQTNDPTKFYGIHFKHTFKRDAIDAPIKEKEFDATSNTNELQVLGDSISALFACPHKVRLRNNNKRKDDHNHYVEKFNHRKSQPRNGINNEHVPLQDKVHARA